MTICLIISFGSHFAIFIIKKNKIMMTTKNNRLLLNSLLNSRDYLFDNFFRPLSNMSLDDSYKVEESESGWILKLSLPGVVKEEIELTTSDDRIYINIDSENGWEKKSQKIFRIPKSVDFNSISAEMKDGILSLNLSTRKKEKNKSIKIN